jgi:hypothetical protein
MPLYFYLRGVAGEHAPIRSAISLSAGGTITSVQSMSGVMVGGGFLRLRQLDHVLTTSVECHYHLTIPA